VEFRGAAAVSHENNDPDGEPSPLTTADAPLDNYGDWDGLTGGVSTPSAWTTNFADLEGLGYKYFQVRVTFTSNANLGLRPALDGLGIVWKN
ncbi:MAG: hypothetical protein QF489_09250, partial [Planctomycetota bacterium]|nr:hypothetical protein [Planctomycetota bacterium]